MSNKKKKVVNDLSDIEQIFHKEGANDGEVWTTEISRKELSKLPPELVKPRKIEKKTIKHHKI